MNIMKIKEIIFLVEEDPEGGYTAKALGESIFTEADSLEEIKENIKNAISCHFDNEEDLPK
ncbi:MAG TPA: 2-oxoisovalerate dehydrogenase [Defluviitoga tunisiensis]|nr:2-oxoisovalerate dehydrogenase [Defluviitoga tunisiensis]HHV01556.1 2-oxoisovalerate dehydrogenase [Defluviitoga tunisiensis]